MDQSYKTWIEYSFQVFKKGSIEIFMKITWGTSKITVLSNTFTAPIYKSER